MTQTTAVPTLTAIRVSDTPVFAIEPAATRRDWMDATNQRFANRCLPLLMANQLGWALLTAEEVRVTWDGSDARDGLRVESPAGPKAAAVSHFGYGILTWQLPYLFRTSQGYDLLVRGPVNLPKDGASPLEGLVETDWAPSTFTMNWKVTRPETPVVFAAGEPIATVTPVRRGDIEAFRTALVDIATRPDLEAAYEQWRASRAQFLVDLEDETSAAAAEGWQRDYFRGRAEDAAPAPGHRTKVRVTPFRDAPDAPDPFG